MKADAYGLGQAPAMQALSAAGCRSFFVCNVAEGELARTALIHRDHVVTVALPENEDALDPAYAMAKPHAVTL